MKKKMRAILFGMGLFLGGVAIDDSITDRYKDISPKELLTASVTLTTVATTGKQNGAKDK